MLFRSRRVQEGVESLRALHGVDSVERGMGRLATVIDHASR